MKSACILLIMLHKQISNTNIYVAFLLIVILGLISGRSQAAQVADPAGSANPVANLTGPTTGAPLAIARRYLQQNKEELGLSTIDIAGAVVTNQYTSSHNGVTHIYLRQQYQGIEVHNANININIAADGSVINLGNRFMPGIDTAINTTVPSLSRGKAISAAAKNLGLDPSMGPVSRNPISPKLVYQPVAKNLVRLAWELEIYELGAKNWWSIRVDAINGAVLDQKNYVDRDNYKVYPVPVESPSHGSRSLVPMPEEPAATWVDAQCTKGNSVDAYLDTDKSNSPTGEDAARACGTVDSGSGELDFDFLIDLLNQEPSQYQDAAVTNLFYWNNVIHDIFYQYGFDEASGNFQEDNDGNGGLGSDSVNAEAQDGGGTNNANFATPPDGSNPRMQMYLWSYTSPARDGDLDNGIIIHEYGHGISNRLTGGPGSALCLDNTEQPGEGWSDFFAVLLTMEPGDLGVDKRGVGTYALGQPTDGPGIRDYPYSTDMDIDPRTYDAIKTASVPHGVGSTWAVMLWEMTWALINEHGFDSDLYNGTGGNNIALQLVVDGLKLQPCSPGFVDARNAILSADQINNSGANQCLIWEAFSKRGLGYSADQGSSSSRSDGTQAFDLPPVCQEVLSVTTTVNPGSVEAGQILTFLLQVENKTTGTLTNVTLTNNIPEHTSYVADSATCDGVESGGTITFPLDTMASGASADCQFQVEVNLSTASEIMSDDMENGIALWSISHEAGSDDWALTTANPHSPFGAAFAEDISTSTDQYLIMADPIAINGNAILRFWHHYDTEAAWDGGVVEISVNGGTWSDLGEMMIKNGYNSTISTNIASAISDRRAFSGNSGGYIETLVDLSSYANNTVQIRFRMATDGLVGGLGWYVDDVEILDDALLSNQACVTADQDENDCDAVKTVIMPAAVDPAPQIAVSPASLSSSQNFGETVMKELSIGNTGNEELIWNIETDSVGNCSSPDSALSWASVDPISGSMSSNASTTVDVSFDSTNLVAAEYNGALCVSSNDSGNSTLTVPLTLAVNDPDSTVERLATGEIPGMGVVTGNFLDTNSDDGASEANTEQHQGGKPSNRFDALEHTWAFQLQSGTGLTVNANAWVTDLGDDGDEIRFSYSRDNVNYTWFYTLTSSDSGNTISAQLLNQSGGAFYIRAEDSDRTKGNNINASLNVDYLSITEGGTPLPPSVIDMTISNLADESGLSNKPNRWDAIVRVTVVEKVNANPVEGAVVSGSWSNDASGGSCTTTSNGQCTIRKPNLKLNVQTVTFEVVDVVRSMDNYVEPGITTIDLKL